MTNSWTIGSVLVLGLCSQTFAQTAFTRWDFNAAGLSSTSPAPTFANGSAGVATLIGGTLPNASGAFISDLGSGDTGTGSAWSISSFPPQGMGSGTAGVEFRADASGYANLSFKFDERPTGTFSDFIRVLYSLDHGTTWTPFAGPPFQLPGNTNATATVWTNNIGSGLNGVPTFALPSAAAGLDDVRVRIVTVFDPGLGNAYSPNSPANGAGAPQTYQSIGAIRFDMVEFRGVASAGSPPSIVAGSSGVSPGTACAGSSAPVRVTLTVAPGTIPASGSIFARADASSIGGPASAPMTHLSTDASGRWLFALDTVVAGSTPVGQRPIAVSVVDDRNRTAATTLWLTITVCCPADLDNGSGVGVRDGGVDINDLLFFLARFELGDIAADLDNGSGAGTPDGGVDVNDLLFFLLHFEAGC